MRRALQIAAGLLVALLLVGLYKAKSDAGSAQAHVRALETEISDAEADVRTLRAQIARRESPANVEALSRTELALTPGAQSAALPESAIDRRLPAPRPPAPDRARP